MMMNNVYTIKRFSVTDNRVILPGNTRPCDPLPQKFTDSPKYRNLKKIILISATEKYGKNTKLLSVVSKKRIKDLKKSISGGYIYENGNYPKEETHYIGSYSKPGKYHRLTKDIDNHNRLDYIVYSPVLSTNAETGEKYLLIRVVLQNCVGHFDWKDGRYYSETEEE